MSPTSKGADTLPPANGRQFVNLRHWLPGPELSVSGA